MSFRIAFSFIFFTLLLSSGTHATSGDLWTADFNDENLDSWTIFGISYTTSPVSFVLGGFSATGGVLQATLSNNSFNIIQRESTNAYGNWSFDYYLSSEFQSAASTYIDFVGAPYSDATLQPIGYTLEIKPNEISGSPGFKLWKNNNGSPSDHGTYTRLNVMDTSVTVDTWLHFEIVRFLDDSMYVFLNGKQILQGTNSEYSTSSYFRILLPMGPQIDNIRVDGRNPLEHFPNTSQKSSKDSTPFFKIPYIVAIFCMVNLYRRKFGKKSLLQTT